MDLKRIKIIIIREYTKAIRKTSFWISTLLFPIFLLGMMALSAFTSTTALNEVDLSSIQDEKVGIVDQSGLINQQFLNGSLAIFTNEQEVINQVRGEELDAAFIYPEDVLQSSRINVYVSNSSIIGRHSYDGLARSLLSQSILLELNNEQKIGIAQGNILIDKTVYESGKPARPLTSILINAIPGILFILLVILSGNYLVLALSEEKESRLVEIMSTIVPTSTLLIGKITALVAIGLTQLLIISSLAAVSVYALSERLPFPIDFNNITVNYWQLVAGAAYLILGYLIIAVMAAGMGAIMPSSREAARLTGIFIFLTISPIYFINTILAEPQSLLSYLVSYIPFTSAPILLIRNALNAIPLWETPITFLALILYLIGAAWIAIKLYNIGSMDYQDRPTLQAILAQLRKK